RHERAGLADQKQLACPFVELVSGVVDHRALGIPGADRPAVVRRALVRDDDPLREPARDREETIEDPGLVPDRRDDDDAGGRLRHGCTIARSRAYWAATGALP